MNNKLLMILLVALGLLLYGCTSTDNGSAPSSAGAPTGGQVGSQSPGGAAPSTDNGGTVGNAPPNSGNGMMGNGSMMNNASYGGYDNGSSDSMYNGNASVDSDPTAGLTSNASLPDAPQ